MATLFNTQTRKMELIDDPDELHNALLSGTHSFKRNDKVWMRGDDGQEYDVPATHVTDAIREGWRVLTPKEQVVGEYVKDNKGLKGSVKTFLGQFADEALLGIPETILDKTGDPYTVAKKNALKEDHEFANTVGGVAGGITGLFAGPTAPLFKASSKIGQAVTKNLASKITAATGEEVGKRTASKIARDIVAKSVGMGVEGGLVSSPRAITETMLGDPDEAAESVLHGIELGALFGGGGAMLGEFTRLARGINLTKRIKSNANEAFWSKKNFDRMSSEKIVEALNPTLGQQERLQGIEEVVDDLGLAVGTKVTRDTKAIGDTLREEKIFSLFSNQQEVFERLQERTAQLGKEVGEKFQYLDDTFGEEVMISRREIGERIKNEIIPELKSSPAYKPYAEALESKVDDLIGKKKPTEQELAGMDLDDLQSLMDEMDAEDMISLTKANQIKADYQEVINTWGLEGKTHKKFLEIIPREINKEIRATIQKVSPESLDEIIKLQRKLGNLRAAENIARKSAARESRNNDFSLTSIIAGGNLATAGAMMGGAPMAAFLGLGGLVGREVSRRFGNQLLSKGLDKFGGLLFAENAMKRTSLKLDRIPEMLKNLKSQRKAPLSTASLSAIQRLMQGTKELGSSAHPMPVDDRNNELDKARTILVDLTANPALLADRIAGVSSVLSENGAPMIGNSLTAKITQALEYLNQVIPKEPAPTGMFAPKRKWKPSDIELNAFEQKLGVVLDPFSVLDDLESGMLTRNQMDALKAVYPKIYQSITNRIVKAATEEEIELDYQSRLKLSLLLDMPLDNSMKPESVALYQQTFGLFEQEQEQEESQFRAQLNVAQGMQSESDKLASR